MILMQGKGVAKGVVHGKLVFFRREDAAIRRDSDIGAEKETARLRQALGESAAQLDDLAETCRREVGNDAALLFETHAMFVNDEDFVTAVTEEIQAGRTAEFAVTQGGEAFAAMFAAMDDAYMQARAADIRDVTRRILSNLTGTHGKNALPDEPVILAADDLAPSETIQLDKTKILGFVMCEGSAAGHTAILARTMGIGAVCGVGDALREEYEGRDAYMDGETGQIVLDPDEITLRQWKEKLGKQEELKRLMESMRGKEDITPDGRKMHVYCNISSSEDTAAVLANDGSGIGLFRSEFLYLASQDFPSEEVQFEAYRSVVAAMNGKAVIIRTLDIGADKQVGYFGLKKEENPALGLRAVRICLSRPEVFRTQLRAIYRASAYGNAAIMFPMITSVWEVRECRRACRHVMQELTDEGVPFDPSVEIGIMIETPASVLIADELAAEVDFFSVGTNDLTQYLLACDRQAGDLGKFLDPHHPSLLRALEMASAAAHRHGIRIGICGELASDTDMLPFFLDLGIDELSVSPPNVLPLRAAIRAYREDKEKREELF